MAKGTGVVGNAIFAQSGGPTTVINASMAGGVLEAFKHRGIKNIYGAKNGILGVLNEELFDFRKENIDDVAGLKLVPAAAAGSCRFKVKTDADYDRILEVFKAHNIRYFFYAGGNDSMDTADKVSRMSCERGHEMIAMGIPKTVDNDLGFTDHCPGYGSVAKYNAIMAMEASRDTEALYTTDTITVQEVMGRNAGWIAASTGLAKRGDEDGPDLIYIPEVPVSQNDMIKQVEAVLKLKKRAFIVVCEGVKNEKGEYMADAGGAFVKDAFGHKQLGGVAEYIARFIEAQVGKKARHQKTGTIQRAGMHCASKTDVDEAFLCGKMAVKHAAHGVTGHMVTLLRKGNRPYSCVTGLAKLSDVANGEHFLPRDFMDAQGTGITKKFRAYLEPIVRGEVKLPMADDGLPIFPRLKRKLIAKKCGDWKK